MLQVREGDLGKLGVLFERHHKLLYNFFLRLTGNREVSEDLVQDVFFRILKYRHTYQGRSAFTLWMFQIARNARFDHLKKKKKYDAVQDDEIPEHISQDPIPVENLERYQETALLHSALAKLADEDREVLVLSRFQNFKYKEIAELLGCAEGTIKARVHRAIKNLRDVFYKLSGEQIK
ncbi:RNA polymerase sigma factor [candidate division KSB1 bacterium]|nr:RNA polymerase sigma factor [candidate division KSB1 bacterium]NIR68611.1 RNA polymerase sigma factor [candidate division KSB1 bacterium]NIS24115.1 RNA polymerase sigma factor [candidate division KSB1 bacterium]NIT71032.1 RNA polymerase sigma factor [candidate division KSB1 bacterium]NIU24734.1 RNA polymerase sigma factor [candidate division KSB1 bacterium]